VSSSLFSFITFVRAFHGNLLPISSSQDINKDGSLSKTTWTSADTARNNSCIVAIVRHHGNTVYSAVGSIPVWVTCGRFPSKALSSTQVHMLVKLALDCPLCVCVCVCV
jgi:hypothetical protein